MVSRLILSTPVTSDDHFSPGRFFAANELKSMMAHLVLTYDVSSEEPGKVPASIRYSTSVSPHREAKVLFRKRRD